MKATIGRQLYNQNVYEQIMNTGNEMIDKVLELNGDVPSEEDSI